MILSVLRNHRTGLRHTLVILGLIALWMAIGSVGGVAQGKLSSVQKNDNASFLPTSAESTLADQAARRFESAQTVPALVVLESANGAAVTPAQLADVQAYVARLSSVDLAGQASKASGEAAQLGDLMVSAPVAVPSQDGLAVLVPIAISPEPTGITIADGKNPTTVVVSAVRASLASDLGAAPTGGTSGLRAWVTGPAAYVADLVAAFGGIDGVLLLVALAAVFLILVLVYRSPFLPLVVILTAVFALTGAGLVVYELAKAGTITLNGQAQGILSILVVGASVDYCLLIVARYREELRHVSSPHAAMVRALRASIPPVAASAGTVTAGLLCLLFSDLSSNRGLGPVGAIGIVSSFLAATTLLPALMLIVGRRSRALFWPRVPRFKHDDPTDGGRDALKADDAAHDPAGSSALWSRVARFVTGHARLVWIGTAVVLLGGAAWLPTFNADGVSSAELFLTPVDSVAGATVLEAHFPGGGVQPATIVAPESGLDAVVAAAKAVPGVVSATPFTAAARDASGAPTASGPALVVDGKVRIDAVTAAASDTLDAGRTVRDLRAAVHAAAPGTMVGGAAAENVDVQASGQHDLRIIIPAVLLVILLILMLLLRSVVAAAALILANVLSFGAVLGLSSVVFQHVLNFPNSDPAVPLFAFVFLVALGVDYSIFLMTRVREESTRFGTDAGVRRGLAVTGSVITSAGVVLAATFGALGVIPLSFLAQLAFIVAFGVLLDTMVVRSLLVPAIVADLGDRVWWPSHLRRPNA